VKTIYGSRIAELQGLSLGARIEVPSALVGRYRCTATRLGYKLSIVEKRGEATVLQRVKETRWGKIKALVCNLPIGGQITVQAGKKALYVTCAKRVRVALEVVAESNGLATLQRRERRTYAACKKEGV
jgi:hypothetical protein